MRIGKYPVLLLFAYQSDDGAARFRLKWIDGAEVFDATITIGTWDIPAGDVPPDSVMSFVVSIGKGRLMEMWREVQAQHHVTSE